MNVIFVENAVERLQNFLKTNNQKTEFQVLTPDASTREYFRVKWNEKSAIACVYGERFKASEHSYLDVTALFQAADLPVAKIYEFDEQTGIVIQEDFGDTILRDVLLKSPDKETLMNEAISLIAGIQAATIKAFESNSIASKLRFDEEKLLWELNFFRTHFFESYKKTNLSVDVQNALTAEFTNLSKELSDKAAVLCHRDFHSANLMIDKDNNLRIIDHQDARIGTASYDLVSLLLDRVLETPEENWLEEKKMRLLLEREKLGLEKIAFKDFDAEFQMQTVQRCLKAVGTFSFQSINRGKTYFIPFIEPTLRIVLETCRRIERFPNLQSLLERNLNS